MQPTLVRSDMHYWRVLPDPRLRSYVLCYFIVRACGRNDAHASPELLIPDGHSEIVFSFGAGYERWAVGQVQRDVMRPSYLIGGRSHSVMTRNLGELDLVGIKLDPRGLRALTGVSLHEFRDATLTLRDLNHRPLLQLEEQLADTRDAGEVVARLDAFLLKHFSSGWRSEASIEALRHRIHDTRGALAIMEWLRERRLDARTVERRFCAAFGMTPKRYARVIRFKHSYHQLISSPRRPIATHVLDGYYDQSHFNREFRYFTGIAPGQRLHGPAQPGTTVTDHLIDGELKRLA